jgi:putative DNA primase/helicase
MTEKRSAAFDADWVALLQVVKSDEWEEALEFAEGLLARRPGLADDVRDVFRGQWDDKGGMAIVEISAKLEAKAAQQKPAAVIKSAKKKEGRYDWWDQVLAKHEARKAAQAKAAAEPENAPAAEDKRVEPARGSFFGFGAQPAAEQKTEEQAGGANEPAAKAPLEPEEEWAERAKAGQSGPMVLHPDAPYDNARIFAQVRYPGDTLLHWQDQFYVYKGNCWEELPDITVLQELYKFLDKTVVKGLGKNYLRFLPEQTVVNKIVHALKAWRNLGEVKELPMWVDGAGPVPAKELVAMQNGLLHLPTRRLLPHTAKYFNLSVLDFGYDPKAKCPQWQKFQHDIWGDDVQAKEAVQEMFGLCVTDQTRFQKAFLFVGPKRGGRGTTGRVLKGLVGPTNYVGTRMTAFVKQFGMQSWIGKKVAVFSDARLQGASSVATELLLNVTGEDDMEIDRKHKEPWNGKLNTRVVVFSNEVLKFKDETAVLPTRFIVFKMVKSWFGKEDPNLTDKLLTELPGILNWSLDGWDRLVERGCFVQPESGRETAELLALESSSILQFVEDRCEFGPEYRVGIQEMLDACRYWYLSRGIPFSLEAQHLSHRLKDAYPQVNIVRPWDGGDDVSSRPRWFSGIRLREVKFR